MLTLASPILDDPLGNAINYKIPIPWKQYQDRDVTDHSEAVKVIYEIDANESQKLKCFLIFQEILKKIEGMPETLRVCELHLRKHMNAFSAASTWQVAAKQYRRHRIENHKNRIRKLEKRIEKTIKRSGTSEARLLKMALGEEVVDVPGEIVARYHEETKEKDAAVREMLEEETQEALGTFSKEEEKVARDVSKDFSVKETVGEVGSGRRP